MIKKLKHPLLLLLTCLLFLSTFTSITTAQSPSTTLTVPIGIAFPPINNQKNLEFTLQQLNVLHITQVRISTSWASREPQPGQYYWEPLDQRINTLTENGIQIFLTIPADAPDWICSQTTPNNTCALTDHQAFQAYLTALLTRYQGQIAQIQFANEWDNLDWYPGTAQQFTETQNIFYQTVKTTSPDLPVVLGGLTISYPLYLAYCQQNQPLDFSSLQLKKNTDLNNVIESKICTQTNLEYRVTYVLQNAQYDLLDLHLYDFSENWSLFTNILTNLSSKPIIVSEFGGPSPTYEIYTQKYHAQRLQTYLETIQTLPIQSAYYFNLVDNPSSYHTHSGLFTIFKTTKPAFQVIQEFLSNP